MLTLSLQIVVFAFWYTLLIFFILMAAHDVARTGPVASSACEALLWEASGNSLYLHVSLSNRGDKHFALCPPFFYGPKKSWFFSLRFLLVVRTKWWLTSSLYVKLIIFNGQIKFFRQVLFFFSAFEALMKNLNLHAAFSLFFSLSHTYIPQVIYAFYIRSWNKEINRLSVSGSWRNFC